MPETEEWMQMLALAGALLHRKWGHFVHQFPELPPSPVAQCSVISAVM